ncbi:hypothetical protein Tco_0973456 [Tanacetum coccineum]
MNQTQGNSKEVETPRYLSLVVPLRKVGDEAVHKELGDRMERVATTASSCEAEQDSGSGPRCQDTILEDVDAQTSYLWDEIEVNAGSSNLLLLVSVNAARHQLLLLVQVPAAEGDSINTSIKGFTYFFIRFHSFKPSLNISPNSISSLIIKIIIMSSPKFAETHNVVAFLEKPTESDGFAEIIDFLKASSVSYALTVNPIIYTSCIQQFWATAQVNMVNEVRQFQALIDKKKIPIIDQPSTSSQPKKKQKSRRKQRKEAETAHAETEEEEHFNTPSNDPLPSGEDSMKLNDLMALCTQLQQQVLDLEKAKSDQAIKIASLKKRVDKLKKRRQLRTTGLTRFKKLGTARRVKSSNAGLGALRMHQTWKSIEVYYADAEVTISTKLDDSTAGEAVTTASVEDSDALIIQVSTADIGEVTAAKINELTLTQTLI